MLSFSCQADGSQELNDTWTRFEAEPAATSFTNLSQINRENVHLLEEAWRLETPGAISMNPIVIDSTMYVFGEGGALLALHAATGEQLWSYQEEVPGSVRARGINYWENEDRSDRRILYPVGAYYFVCVDAQTGRLSKDFADEGVLDLRNNLGVDPELVTRGTSSMPGTIYDDIIILGSSVGEGYFASPGHIRAYNVKTGALEWVFHTLPKKGEFGYDTWPEGRPEIGGGANAWGGLSVDEERGIVYIPLGSANYDFYGVDRPGENLFANSIVALNARTGERIWHYQTVHHDLWDYDLSSSPVLMTVTIDGKERDIVVLAAKTGLVFVFDRVTGEPIWPIIETPVPASDIPGEQAWPTQPIPSKPPPFIPTSMSLDGDINPYLHEDDRDSLVEMVKSMNYKGLYTPPSTIPTLQVPGNRGGANWGSSAADPRDASFFVISYNLPSVLHLEEIVTGKTGTGSSNFDKGQEVYQSYCIACHGANRAGQGDVPSLIGVTDRLSHDDFQEVVQNGKGMMPGFQMVSAGMLNNLQMFLSNPDLALMDIETKISNDEVGAPMDVRYQSAWKHILDRNGLPIIKPPWFRMTAYDMTDGSMKWQVPIGRSEPMVEQGITDSGTNIFVIGGPSVTAGGLIFLGTDTRFQAFNSETGEELWSTSVPGASEGKPTIYDVNGQQYVVTSTIGTRRWAQLPQLEESDRTPTYMVYSLEE